MSLVSEVASAYLTLRADQELLRLTSDTLATQKRSYGLTTQLVEAGNSTQLDLRRAEIALRTAEANQRRADAALACEQAKLAVKRKHEAMAALQTVRTDERAAVEAVAELQQTLLASRAASEDAASSVY